MNFDSLLPLLIAVVLIFAVMRRVDAYAYAVAGARDGIKTVLRIFPALLMLMFAVGALRASGAYDCMCRMLDPILGAVGIPPETAPLILIRPISGSGALAVATDIIIQYGPDSLVGKTAAVMMGSTETTFYAISVYLGAAKIRSSWKIMLSAILADITGFIAAAAAGAEAARTRGKGPLATGLLIGVVITTLLLMTGFIIAGSELAPDGILSVAAFTVSGAAAGSVLLRNVGRKRKKRPVRRKAAKLT